MKNITFFKILFALIVTYSCIYPMMRLPATTSNAAAAQAAKLAKYMPGYTTASTTVQAPRVQLGREQIDMLASEIAQDLEQSTTKPWVSFKTPTGFKTPFAGMFKTTQPMLMRWDYTQSPESILKVSDNPTEAELKSAHRKMAMKHHPDRGGNPEDFRKIQKAYEYLKYLSQTGQKHSENQYQQTAQDQEYKQTHSYQQKTKKIHPSEQAPSGNWVFVGPWKIIDTTYNILNKPIVVWERKLEDKDEFFWIEKAFSLEQYEYFKYTKKPELGWERYNQLYMTRAYAKLGEAKLKELLSTANVFKEIFIKYFTKILPVAALIPAIKKEMYEGLTKSLTIHFKLLNIGRSNQTGKFDPYNSNPSTDEIEELQKATEKMEKNLYAIYPDLQLLLDKHFATIEKIREINDALNKTQGTWVPLNINTVKRIENSLDSDSKLYMFGFTRTKHEVDATLLTLMNLLLFFAGYKTIKFVKRILTNSEQTITENPTVEIVENIEPNEEVIEFVDIKNPLDIEYQVIDIDDPILQFNNF
jgi:curved DNA-binding protein CbpA